MYLGIDIGTSELKALIVNPQGEIVASNHATLSVQRPHPHWAEQDPERWWQACGQAIAGLRQQAPDAWAAIRAIGLSGQMHGAVLLDAAGEVLRPCILWNDTRSAAQCDALRQQHPQMMEIAANLIMPGFTAPKLHWVAEHEPEIFRRIDKVLLPKDYLRWRLTGRFVSEPSDAAGTLWLDVAQRDWSDALLAISGLTRAQMPELVEGSAVSATLRADLASEWGLAATVSVAGGGGDNAASAVGVGAVNAGDAFISLGTSGVIFVVNDRLRADPQSGVHAFCHALPGRWHQMSVMLSAASCLRWLCNLLSVTESQLMDEMAQLSAEQLRQAPLFLPYLSGERTPHNDPQATGAFFHLRHETPRALLGYAVIEGVAFGLADGLAVLGDTQQQIQQCSLTGGGARSTLWAQLIADVLQLPIVTHPASASGALGAARLAWLADGGSEADVCLKPPVQARYQPDAARGAVLQQRLRLFRELYVQQQQARALLPA
ncbi:xylulokinase [Pantoea dispersa]|uniref:Xylulose kinase n=2 Tax=Pantoea dispersa TaxID=59814 RepID=A0ABY3A1H4_9GAMM|nr:MULTISPECIES: xylulokinase [Pantoea]MDT8850840.1 xylulokinase [Pantoea dispersa]PPC72205.1 xylulokinase [Pantoea sp. ICBG 985]QZY91501.1 xylulokinase [Pantoea dispersa]TQC76495.1 xylulokinase [Pantoea dispersa]UXO69575.1 xylulokinase [Pantoea dispersa]